MIETLESVEGPEASSLLQDLRSLQLLATQGEKAGMRWDGKTLVDVEQESDVENENDEKTKN